MLLALYSVHAEAQEVPDQRQTPRVRRLAWFVRRGHTSGRAAANLVQISVPGKSSVPSNPSETPMPHALIIDDDPDFVASLAELVERQGFSVAIANTLEQARPQINEHRPSL